jgi:hypothetical protein
MKAYLTIVLLAAGCTSLGPWESPELDCEILANASIKAAAQRGFACGYAHCILPGTTEGHQVVWIWDHRTGRFLVWDAAFGRYRHPRNLGRVLDVRLGRSDGVLDFVPMTAEKLLQLEASVTAARSLLTGE